MGQVAVPVPKTQYNLSFLSGTHFPKLFLREVLSQLTTKDAMNKQYEVTYYVARDCSCSNNILGYWHSFGKGICFRLKAYTATDILYRVNE